MTLIKSITINPAVCNDCAVCGGRAGPSGEGRLKNGARLFDKAPKIKRKSRVRALTGAVFSDNLYIRKK